MNNWVPDGGTKQQRTTELQGRRISFFTSVVPMGGSEICLAWIMKAAHLAGAQVFCWTPPNAAIRELFTNGDADSVQFLDCEASRPGTDHGFWQPIGRLIRFFSHAVTLRRAFARLQPDLVFINVPGSETAALGARLAGLNRVTLHYIPPRVAAGRFLRRVVDLLLKATTFWSVPVAVHVSESNRRGWCRLCCYPTRRTRVILNGVPGPMPAINVQTKREELGVPAEAFVFCVPARIASMKGQMYLLEAIGAHREAFSGSQVLLCGGGPEEPERLAQCERLGISGTVRFLGWRRDIREIIQASDCVVLPSLYESFSLAAAEAAMEGKPVIATNVGGLPEVVLDQETGLLVPPKAPAELGQAMLKAMANREWLAELGREARPRAVRLFTLDRMLSEYVRLIEEQSR